MTATTFHIDAVATRTARLWRCRPWNTNPLMRWPDRLLAVARVCAVGLLLAAVPVAGAVGTITYSDDVADIQAERAGVDVVQGLVLDRPERTSGHLYQARVSWPGTSGPVVATVTVSRKTTEGQVIPVWLNDAGVPVREPRTTDAAVVNGIGAAVVILVTAGLVAWAMTYGTAFVVARRRSAAWDHHLSALNG
ncbi:hypothetical protein ACIO52_18665 [Nocardia sp. NPDC087230]|uniref:Rv1733c family protein n=1 Tax=Nocardia sp. NPDC087230 TaxID=3364331 RepID=UPI00380CD6F3